MEGNALEFPGQRERRLFLTASTLFANKVKSDRVEHIRTPCGHMWQRQKETEKLDTT
jgi:hypothetical protein